MFIFLYKRLHLWNIIQVTTWVGEWEYIGYDVIFVGWSTRRRHYLESHKKQFKRFNLKKKTH